MSGDMLSSVEELLVDVRLGKPVILVDDENRENEGDLVVAAEMASAEIINFMAKEGRGLICLPMERGIAERLGLELMGRGDNSRHRTAFTVSIEAKNGVTTGISAADRAHTIRTAIDPECTADDIATPGHVFPLVARDGGVLVRAGHTEAAVDLARMAGLRPAGVICEIMNDDGTMARLPDLIPFARRHGLKIGTIESLIAYRRRTESLVRRVYEGEFSSRFGGDFKLIVFTNTLEGSEHVALVKGDVSGGGPVSVRMHAVDFIADILGGGGDSALHRSMEAIGKAGRGAVVILRDPSPGALSRKLCGEDGVQGDSLRRYGIGAQILLDLGIREMELLTDRPKNVVGLEGYGLYITGHRPLGPV